MLAVMHEGEELVSGDERVSHWEFLGRAAFHASWWSLCSAELKGTAALSVWPGSSDTWALIPGQPRTSCVTLDQSLSKLVCVESVFQFLMSFHIPYLWYFSVNLHCLWEEGRVGKSLPIYQIRVKPKWAGGLSRGY